MTETIIDISSYSKEEQTGFISSCNDSEIHVATDAEVMPDMIKELNHTCTLWFLKQIVEMRLHKITLHFSSYM